MTKTIINLKGILVCKACGHPKECHTDGQCVAYNEPCPCRSQQEDPRDS